MQPLISIVLPIYNGEKFMRHSIDSVIEQTYENWELLIIDDGSTDHTAQIAQEYVLRDPRVQYHKNPQNLRLPKTLNRGFFLAKGDYLTWTSDDNYFFPQALETMLSALLREKKEFVFASCDVIDETDRIVECIMVDKHSPLHIVGGNPVGACFLYSRKVYETVGDYDPELTLVEDLDYWQRICMRFPPACISQKLYAYRWHDGALTSTMKKDVFHRTLEKCLLKNRPGFGRIGPLASYFYYRGLYNCRLQLGEVQNPYGWKYRFYSIFYVLLIRVPGKLRRILRKSC